MKDVKVLNEEVLTAVLVASVLYDTFHKIRELN